MEKIYQLGQIYKNKKPAINARARTHTHIFIYLFIKFLFSISILSFYSDKKIKKKTAGVTQPLARSGRKSPEPW